MAQATFHGAVIPLCPQAIKPSEKNDKVGNLMLIYMNNCE